MVHKVTQRIQVYGASFKVESEKPLSATEKQVVIHSFEHYPPNVVRVLARGRYREPPLKIVIAPKDQWSYFIPTTSVLDSLTTFYSQHETDVEGFYLSNSNTLVLGANFLSIRDFALQHEIAHVIDDFGATCFTPSPSNTENCWASSFLLDNSALKNYPSTYLNLSAHARAGILDRREMFANVLALDSVIGLRSAARYFEEFPFQSLADLLANYPHIEGVGPRDQFQTNDPPPLFESERNK